MMTRLLNQTASYLAQDHMQVCGRPGSLTEISKVLVQCLKQKTILSLWRKEDFKREGSFWSMMH